MKGNACLAIALLLLVLLLLPVTCQAPYSNPPATFQDSDLVGIWEAHYWGGGVDRLIIRADGTFKQIYRKSDCEYKTPWNKWWVERLPDGRARVHLEGARYYLIWVERGDYLFHDPFGNESIEMTEELVLNIRRLSSGEIILHHMWDSSDRGFAIIGGEAEMFRRVKTP